MSSDVKAILKEARQLLKQNEYTDAMKKCQKVLKKDKNNYLALILLAAAMREIEEYKSHAVLVLEKAIDVQPENPLAWQGLVAHYENETKEQDWSKLALAYCQILQLDSKSTKFGYILNKVAELSLRIKDEAVLAGTIETLSKLRKMDDQEKVNLIDKSLVWILMENLNSANKYSDLFESVLASVVGDVNVVNAQDYYRKYLETLYDRNKLEILIKESIKMHNQFPQDSFPLEYICKVYIEESILRGISVDVNIVEFYEPLLKLNAESEAGIIAKAVHLKSTGNLIGGREILNQLRQHKPELVYVWIILSEINATLYCWEDAENCARQVLRLGLRLGKYEMKDDLLQKIQLILVESMSRESGYRQKWENALEICEKLLANQFSTRLKLIQTRIKILLADQDVWTELKNFEFQDETKGQTNILKAFYLMNCKQFEEAANILDTALETSEAWLLLGKIYWEMAEYNHSLMAFLNGVKLDRYNWECFVYLGRYYREHGSDIERSRRCYQTALQINPRSEQAGIGLSIAYRLQKNQEANMQLLQRSTVQESGPKWAWLQLGLQYLDQGDAVQAIKAFKHVIRADPNDNHSWESIADAYLVRGAHVSALKSYQRALELCPESLYPMIQLANIKLMIGQYIEAKEDFEHILLNDPRYVPALKGLAETCLRLAKENIKKQFLGRARRNLQQAINSLTIAVMESNDLSCIWKLLGDVCYRTARMPKKYSYLEVMRAFVKSDISTKESESTIIEEKDIILLATRCFCRALSLTPDSTLLWHDLACCYLMRLQIDPLTENSNKIASKCLAAVKQSVKLCPSSCLHWNLLGVISMSRYIRNYALAQHAYVMAIDKELNNALVWSNLGTLYLYMGYLHKANEAYSQALRSDPSYINSWIGQGLIAEKMQRKDAMDLFRHSTELGYHSQAAVGYAHWVLVLLLNSDAKNDYLYTYMIENMHAISVSTDVLNWYIEYHPNDCNARNAYGLLLERQKLYKSAAREFSAALNVSTNEQEDSIRINLTRVLIHLNEYDKAVEICRFIKNRNFNSQCHVALALFKAKQYEESYTEYERALESFADTGLTKGHVLCAMAAMAYIFQGVEDVKTLLFQCIQIDPSAVSGLLAAASLGILHEDINLTRLVLDELKTYENDSGYGHHVANLSAYSYLIQNDVTSAIAVLSKAIHNHPYDVRYWLRLLRILLETDLKSFERCVEKTLFLSRTATAACTNIVHVACASTFSHLMHKDAVRLAQKLLFTYPGHIESWATFIATFLPRCINSNSKSQWLLALISIVEKSIEPGNQMSKWLYENKKRIMENETTKLVLKSN